MRAFAVAWPDREIVQRVIAQLPWRQNNPEDKPTLGLLLVRQKNHVLVEYALGECKQPISVAEWSTQLTQSLPNNLCGSLPTVEEIEAELSGD